MRAFPQQEMNLDNRFRSDVRFQPKQEWDKKTRRMFRRHKIARANKYDDNPERNRQPVLKKGSHLGA